MNDGFTLEPEALARAEDLVARIAADLTAEREKLAGSVAALLTDGWTGIAAAEYGEAWADWREGADQVLAALGEISRAMGVARSELVTSDDDAAGRSETLSARLQERLS